MKYGEIIRKVYDVSYASLQLNVFVDEAAKTDFTRSTQIDNRAHRIGNERDVISEYEYISTGKMSSNRKLRIPLKEVAASLNVKDHMLIHNVLQFQPSDFLDWQDHHIWEKRINVTANSIIVGCPMNFFSIALTEGNTIEFKDEIVNVPIYHGIVFSPADVHRIPKVDNTHTWLIFGIPYHLDVGELLEQGVACK
jgi:hypothetical protein